MMQSKRKMLTYMLATGMAFGVTAGMAPTAFAADTSAEVRTQAMEEEIVELTERLNAMESHGKRTPLLTEDERQTRKRY